MFALPLNQRVTGAFWVLLWALMYAFLGVLMKTLGPIPKSIVILIRTFTQTLILLSCLSIKGLETPRKSDFKWLLLRALIAYPAMRCTYLAYAHLPLSTATSIGFIEPSMQILLSVFLTGLYMSSFKWFLVLLGYGGVLLMNYPIQPGYMIWIGVALLANLFASITRLITKKVAKNYRTISFMFYTNLLFFPISIALALPDIIKLIQGNGSKEVMTAYHIGTIILVAILAFVAHYAYTKAVNLVNFDILGPMTYLKLFFSIPLGFFFFSEIPTYYALLGAFLIILSNYLLVFKTKQKKT